MKASDMSADQIRHLALRCTDTRQLPLAKMEPRASLAAGNFYAWVAKAEEAKRYWRAAKKDLSDRSLGLKTATNDCHGEFGRVRIGSKWFSLFQRSGMLVRDDFAAWCERNWDRYCRMDGSERDSTRSLHQEDVTVDAALHMWKDIRKRVQALPDATAMYHDSAWLTEFEMRRSLQTFAGALDDFARKGVFYPILKCDADFLAAKVAYRQRKFAACKGHLLDLAAAAMKAALFVQEKHSADCAKEEK